mmetsp:Transcript_37487/g.104169  ORF Transcript_37487/g.104169 Transcript_37487/m.104169 type:complete len:212 (+) Transcript_37487:823-1458(+)
MLLREALPEPRCQGCSCRDVQDEPGQPLRVPVLRRNLRHHLRRFYLLWQRGAQRAHAALPQESGQRNVRLLQDHFHGRARAIPLAAPRCPEAAGRAHARLPLEPAQPLRVRPLRPVLRYAAALAAPGGRPGSEGRPPAGVRCHSVLVRGVQGGVRGLAAAGLGPKGPGARRRVLERRQRWHLSCGRVDPDRRHVGSRGFRGRQRGGPGELP